MFGQALVDVLAPHHVEAIEWHWNSVMRKRRGEPVEKSAYIAAWSRSHMKSTLARRIAVADACLSGAGYCLYVSGTKDKVRGHALSIEKLISSKKVREYYPDLAKVKTNAKGQSKGWTRDFIYTGSGYVFHFVSLKEGVAGANVDDVRPTLIIPDDVDSRDDSPAVSESRLQVFTREVLPTKTDGTLFFFAQNLINRWSIAYRIVRQKVRVLTNRVPVKVIPAIRHLKTETRTIEGIVRDIIVAGDPTWPGYDLARAQSDIDDSGLEAFLAEYQHEVDQHKTGLILNHWDERVHVITWSQFAKVYGFKRIPKHWTKYVGHDWGNVHPNVTSLVALAPQSARLPGLHFLYAGVTGKTNSLVDDCALSIIERIFPDVNLSSMRNIDPGLLSSWAQVSITDVLNAPREVAASTIRKQVVERLRSESFRSWCMSHERKTEREVYQRAYGLPFTACNPGASGGVSLLQRFLQVDYSQDHPFKPGEKGLAGFYAIVDDDQYYRIEDNETISLARDDRGLKLWRDQFPEWVWRDPTVTETGISLEKPIKVNDDAGNSLMMIYCHNPKQAELSESEKVEAAIPEQYRIETLRKDSPNGIGLSPEQELAHVLARAKAKNKASQSSSVVRFDESGRRIK